MFRRCGCDCLDILYREAAKSILGVLSKIPVSRDDPIRREQDKGSLYREQLQ